MQDTEAIWQNIFSNKEWGKYPSEAVIRFIANNFYKLKDRSKIKILELGLGTGANLWFCAREGFSISGIEYSQIGIERFKQRLENEGLSHFIDRLRVGDYERELEGFENESFDAWIDSYSLAYNDFEKSKKVIEKAILKLKKGGRFLSITPSLNNEGFYEDENEAYHSVKPSIGSAAFTGRIRWCDEEDLKKLYEGKNYKIISTQILSLRSLEKTLTELYIIEGVREE